jgi:hypothetical protein
MDRHQKRKIRKFVKESKDFLIYFAVIGLAMYAIYSLSFWQGYIEGFNQQISPQNISNISDAQEQIVRTLYPIEISANNYVNTASKFFIYNDSNSKKALITSYGTLCYSILQDDNIVRNMPEKCSGTLTLSELMSSGGVCWQWAEYYRELGESDGYYSKLNGMSVDDGYAHVVTDISNSDAWCTIDQQSVSCFEFAKIASPSTNNTNNTTNQSNESIDNLQRKGL